MTEKAFHRTCPACGRRFTANWNTRKYCSDECAKRYRSERARETRREVKGE